MAWHFPSLTCDPDRLKTPLIRGEGSKRGKWSLCATWLLQQKEKQSEDFAELWDNFLYPVLPKFANRLIEHQGLRLYQEMGQQLSQLYWHNAPRLALA